MKQYVYIAGPMTKGNYVSNIAKGCDAGDAVWQAGYYPYIPHLSAFWEFRSMSKKDYEDMMDLDFAWLEKCDALIRLEGESPGADREVQHAISNGIPVYYGVGDFLRSYPGKSQEY